MGRRPGKHPQTHLAQVITGMMAMAEGKAVNKGQAAQMAGTSPTSLRPVRLAALAARSPALQSLLRTDALEITAEITREDGSKRRVSMRDALSTGAENCVRILGELAPRVGSLTKEEERRYGQASRWLAMCRQMGLFGDNEGATLPSELRTVTPGEGATPDHFRTDGLMERMAGRMLTVLSEPETIPIDVETIAPAGNVEQ